MSNPDLSDSRNEVAIIGMAGRFPRARSLAEFWRNLKGGVESITRFEDEVSVPKDGASSTPGNGLVRAGGILEEIEWFDADFFGFNPRDAELLDPQHRLFLECVWEALENAGYEPESYPGSIGVYASVGVNTYWLVNLLSNRDLVAGVGSDLIRTANRLDNLATRVSYKLNLKGPSINIQTGCSASLVAVHLACTSLLIGESDMALAGGVRISVTQSEGSVYRDGGIVSPDGRCRAFDAQAQGTVTGQGVGVVLLKRLDRALEDRDNIIAVIKGSAVNNDGSVKVGFTAPSVEGQSRVISEALAMAGVSAESISYVEAHGTGTILGDPIEVRALSQAFRAQTEGRGFCALGSVKTNIGHLDTAAGVAGLIKTALALRNRELPPSLHYRAANPEIDFESSPFYVNTELRAWGAERGVRRAGVSSFGIGGTNAHLILEEAPEAPSSVGGCSWQILPLSARSESALEKMTENLAARLEERPGEELADVAYTLQVGRREFDKRRAVVCGDARGGIERLKGALGGAIEEAREGWARVAYLYPGQGSQRLGMGLELSKECRRFREELERSGEILRREAGLKLEEILSGSDVGEEEGERRLMRTAQTQPALVVVEYALSAQMEEWGVKPVGMLGHSLGEYVAACVSGVMSLEECLRLVSVRGRLMEREPEGAMLSVEMSEEEAKRRLRRGLWLAAVNGERQSVISGEKEEIERLEKELEEEGIWRQRLKVSHAFHSGLLKGMREAYERELRGVKLKEPRERYISNVSGGWIGRGEATEREYWIRQMEGTVRFWDGVREVEKEGEVKWLEMGPGEGLSALLKMNGRGKGVKSAMGKKGREGGEVRALMEAVGGLWESGVKLKWEKMPGAESRRRVELPAYPFERQRYWIDPPKASSDVFSDSPDRRSLQKQSSITDWFYAPTLKRVGPVETVPLFRTEKEDSTWLILGDDTGIGPCMRRILEQLEMQVITVEHGERYARTDQYHYTIAASRRGDYDELLADLRRRQLFPSRIVYLAGAPSRKHSGREEDRVERIQNTDFYSLLFLVQSLAANVDAKTLRLDIVTSGAHEVIGQETLRPENSLLAGAGKVVSQEYPHIISRCIDLEPQLDELRQGEPHDHKLARRLVAELISPSMEPIVAHRGNYRWVTAYERLLIDDPPIEATRLRENGIYLITGGLGRIGLALAEFLARTVRARLVLLGRGVGNSAQSSGALSGDWRRKRILRIEELGAEVLFLNADVSDEYEMKQALHRIKSRFGGLHGVIHAAGITRSFHSIERLDPGLCEEQFRAKVNGLQALEKILKGEKLDFCLLCSSLSAVLGGLGYFAHAAANAYMDAFAYQLNRNGTTRWISVNWDGWRFDEQGQDAVNGSAGANFAMTADEGVKAFRRILSRECVSQIAVSSANLNDRIARWVRLETLRADHKNGQSHAKSSTRARPSMPSSYIEPQSETEMIVAGIWEELLGISQIGARDDFFELGGHSLLGIQLISRLREIFHIELPARTLFERPTIAEIAMEIEKLLMEKIENLTEEEALLLLGKESSFHVG